MWKVGGAEVQLFVKSPPGDFFIFASNLPTRERSGLKELIQLIARRPHPGFCSCRVSMSRQYSMHFYLYQ